MGAARRKLLKSVSLDAGQCLMSYFGKELAIEKKSELDLVTVADKAAEKRIVEQITARFPDDTILAEEGGGRQGTSSFRWIVDPLDGTTNFAHGLPQFAVSIALAQEERVLAGVVFDPAKGELFEAYLGEGARLNGEAIQVGRCSRLSETLTVTGFSYDRRRRMPVLLERVGRILTHCQGFRRLGSAALDLAYVAHGRFDVFLEDGLHPWDTAAGQLLITEAGGAVCNLDGTPLDLARGEILAANPVLLGQALENLT